MDVWGVFLSGFVGGAGVMVVIYSYIRDRTDAASMNKEQSEGK